VFFRVKDRGFETSHEGIYLLCIRNIKLGMSVRHLLFVFWQACSCQFVVLKLIIQKRISIKRSVIVANQKKDFLLVSKDILPEAIIKTAQAKELLAQFDALTINEACERVDISRSAFYKYKDGVFPFYEASKGRIITLALILIDRAGILSNVLNYIASVKGNVLTINQGIPLQGIANVSVAIETEKMEETIESLLAHLRELDGVRKIELISKS
jgi:chorismate mutase